MECEQRLCFLAEWPDPCSGIVRHFQLIVYLKDFSVEMYDIRNHRVFLRRTGCPSLSRRELRIGGKVLVCSRLLSITNYGDAYTAGELHNTHQKTLALVKPQAMAKMGTIMEVITEAGLTITQARMVKFERKDVEDYSTRLQANCCFNEMINELVSGPALAMELMGKNAVLVWRRSLGFSTSAVDESREPDCAKGDVPNLANDKLQSIGDQGYGSPSSEEAVQELDIIFPSTGHHHGPSSAVRLDNSTCCIIKPHAISEGLVGKIVNAILEAGFEISALRMLVLEIKDAKKFLEVYYGVVQEYTALVTELSTGPCMALQVCGESAVESFRELCGPSDPEIARTLRPNSLRALFGKNKVQNALHCTDLPEDGKLEVEYFFKVLSN
uniref:nucleoside diphosphate kinase homolog 7 isoform X2 n=1 Tax=Myxine glutinosa TaxID=7769 RepID=UPI00358EA752